MPANRFALNRRHALTAAAGALMALSITAPAAAQTFPAKPITFVVPFAAGSATDQLARAIGQSITNERIGKSTTPDQVWQGFWAGSCHTPLTSR